MTKILSNRWICANKANPCPICTGKAKSDGNGVYKNPSLCMIAISGEVCLCRHFIGESDKYGNPIRYGTNGIPPLYLHRLKNPRPIPVQRPIASTEPKINIEEAWSLLRTNVPSFTLDSILKLSRQLGVSATALTALGIVQASESTWAFPMYSVDILGGRKLVGIRIRKEKSNAKWSIKGSTSGLFMADNSLDSDSIVICEGVTDAAVIIDVGPRAVGKATALACDDECCTAAGGRDVFICGDNDSDGLKGAKQTAIAISRFAKSVRVAFPPRPYKDLREWRLAGATDGIIHEWIRCTKDFVK